jgi:putative SOS response-associated peptidase YedK
MCTNFTPTRKAPWVKEHFGIDLPTSDYPVEAYPGYVAPIVVKSHNSGRVACGLARFGLIPSWAKDEKISRHTYNARSETVREKPSYRNAWKQRKYAITLLDNFYEPNYESGKAERWKIELAVKEPFGIASLWETWINPSSGEVITSFTMLTVNADEHPVMKKFHRLGDEKRTPLVLSTSQFNQWLSANETQAIALMKLDNMPQLLATKP